MATFTWIAQGTDGATNVTLGATDKLAFYGANFGDAITVNAYQSSTHSENAAGSQLCATVHAHNVKYIDATHYSLDGGASTVLDATHPTTAQCTLKINFSHTSAVAVSGAIFWAYDGTTDTVAPTEVTVQAIEQGDTGWTAAAPRSGALTLTDQASNTSHDYFIGISVSPTAVGDKTAFAFKIELVYQ